MVSTSTRFVSHFSYQPPSVHRSLIPATDTTTTTTVLHQPQFSLIQSDYPLIQTDTLPDYGEDILSTFEDLWNSSRSEASTQTTGVISESKLRRSRRLKGNSRNDSKVCAGAIVLLYCFLVVHA